MSYVLPRVEIAGVDIAGFTAAAFEAGLAVALDIRTEIGDQSALDIIRAEIDAGRALSLWDSHEVVPPFALGRLDDLFVVFDGAGKRSNFATLEAALKHGITDFEGYPRGR